MKAGFRMIPAGVGLMAPALMPWHWFEFALVFGMWVVMMVGMMMPSAAPMILIYARVGRQAGMQGKPFAATGWFCLGYFLGGGGFFSFCHPPGGGGGAAPPPPGRGGPEQQKFGRFFLGGGATKKRPPKVKKKKKKPTPPSLWTAARGVTGWGGWGPGRSRAAPRAGVGGWSHGTSVRRRRDESPLDCGDRFLRTRGKGDPDELAGRAYGGISLCCHRQLASPAIRYMTADLRILSANAFAAAYALLGRPCASSRPGGTRQ